MKTNELINARYTLTGQQKYLDAVLGAWDMHRDPVKGWIHVGGSLAINEGDIYEPGTFWLRFVPWPPPV